MYECCKRLASEIGSEAMRRGTDIWRQFTAVAVAWIFALQVMSSALFSVAAISDYQADQTTSFTLCHHDGANADQPAAPPPSLPCNHCLLCLLGSNPVHVAVVVLLIAIGYVSRLRWTPTGLEFSEPPVPDGARPRGPPFQA
jgi:hypothetical protein